MGNQLTGLAAGANTYKLPLGNRYLIFTSISNSTTFLSDFSLGINSVVPVIPIERFLYMFIVTFASFAFRPHRCASANVSVFNSVNFPFVLNLRRRRKVGD